MRSLFQYHFDFTFLYSDSWRNGISLTDSVLYGTPMGRKTPPTFSPRGYIFFHFGPDPKKVPSSFSISSAFCPFRLSPRHPSLATPDSPESPKFFGGAAAGRAKPPPDGRGPLQRSSRGYQPGGQVISRPASTWKCRCGTVCPPCGPQLVTTRKPCSKPSSAASRAMTS